MISRATGLFRIYRGTSINSSGDETDADIIVASNVPLGLRNQSVLEDNPNTANPRVISAIRGRAAVDLDLRAQDRIKNQETGQRYVIDTVVEPLSSTRNSDLQFSCHRVN